MTRKPCDIPAAFAPFEYLLGGWKGQGIPKDDPAKQFRGWTETHSWAWIFVKGKPAGLSVTIEGGKVLATGKLTYDVARKRYHLEGDRAKAARRTDRLRGHAGRVRQASWCSSERAQAANRPETPGNCDCRSGPTPTSSATR